MVARGRRRGVGEMGEGGQRYKLPVTKEISPGGFPGGTVVKNPPADAGDMGSSSGPGRSHMPWSN